jgi:uncharacterized Zn finger protein
VITREMLQRLVGANAATRGLAYAREGRVVQLDDAKAGWLHARVQGERDDAYRQWIHLKRDRAGRIVGIDGQCDCPMAWNCKHVAAAAVARDGTASAEVRAEIKAGPEERQRKGAGHAIPAVAGGDGGASARRSGWCQPRRSVRRDGSARRPKPAASRSR